MVSASDNGDGTYTATFGGKENVMHSRDESNLHVSTPPLRPKEQSTFPPRDPATSSGSEPNEVSAPGPAPGGSAWPDAEGPLLERAARHVVSFAVYAMGDITAQKLAVDLGIEPGLATRLVDRLTELKVLRRNRSHSVLMNPETVERLLAQLAAGATSRPAGHVPPSVPAAEGQPDGEMAEHPAAARQGREAGGGSARSPDQNPPTETEERVVLPWAEQKPETRTLRLSEVIADPGLQARASVNPKVIEEYAREMREGINFPEVVVFQEGNQYWLADGYQRLAARKLAGSEEIAATIYQGSRPDALLYAVGANTDHGVRRTRRDTQRAIDLLLDDPVWGGRSSRWMAKALRGGVDKNTVEKRRKKRERSGEIHQCPRREAMDGRLMPVLAAPEPGAEGEAARVSPPLTPSWLKAMESALSRAERFVSGTADQDPLSAKQFDQVNGAIEQMITRMRALADRLSLTARERSAPAD